MRRRFFGGRGPDAHPRSSPGERACWRSPGRYALQSDGRDRLFCGGAGTGKSRVVRRP